MAVNFQVVDEATWNELQPSEKAKQPGQWDEVLGVLASGKIVTLSVTKETLKGTRIGLGRVATKRGMRLEYRSQGTTLAVRMVSSEKKAETKSAKSK